MVCMTMGLQELTATEDFAFTLNWVLSVVSFLGGWVVSLLGSLLTVVMSPTAPFLPCDGLAFYWLKSRSLQLETHASPLPSHLGTRTDILLCHGDWFTALGRDYSFL